MKDPKNKEECLQMTIDSLYQVIENKDKFIKELLASVDRLNQQAETVAKAYLDLEKHYNELQAAFYGDVDTLDIETVARKGKDRVLESLIKKLEEL